MEWIWVDVVMTMKKKGVLLLFSIEQSDAIISFTLFYPQLHLFAQVS